MYLKAGHFVAGFWDLVSLGAGGLRKRLRLWGWERGRDKFWRWTDECVRPYVSWDDGGVWLAGRTEWYLRVELCSTGRAGMPVPTQSLVDDGDGFQGGVFGGFHQGAEFGGGDA
jgi:hypothetical protein